MDERQQRRIASNESRFRAINEEVRRRVDAFHGYVDLYSMMCECAVSECQDMIELTCDEYDHVRSNPRWFLVMPDHLLPAAEEPVVRRDTYWIVEKRGEAGRVAEETYNDL